MKFSLVARVLGARASVGSGAGFWPRSLRSSFSRSAAGAATLYSWRPRYTLPALRSGIFRRYGNMLQLGWVLGHSSLAATSGSADPMPVFTPGSVILFQGDSITAGGRLTNVADLNHILGHGYQATVSARFGADLPERHLTFVNRGVAANTLTDLARRWKIDTIEIKPDLLSILIGVNDLNRRVSAEQYERQYDGLLTFTLVALPNVRLVLGEPFGLPAGAMKNRWPQYSADLAVRQAIVARLAKKYNAALVRYQSMFDQALIRAPAEYWIWDGVHPTYSGHQLMADEWTRTVRAFWPGAPPK